MKTNKGKPTYVEWIDSKFPESKLDSLKLIRLNQTNKGNSTQLFLRFQAVQGKSDPIQLIYSESSYGDRTNKVQKNRK